MEKKDTGLIVLVIVLSLLVVGLGGYTIYDKVLKNDTEVDNTDNVVDNTDNVVDNTDNVGKEEVDNADNVEKENTNNIQFHNFLDIDNTDNLERENIKQLNDIINKKIAFLHNYLDNPNTYCGQNRPLEHDSKGYYISKDFSNYADMLTFLKKYMSEDIITKRFPKDRYLEQDGKLYCQDLGKGDLFGPKEMISQINDLEENKIDVTSLIISSFSPYDEEDQYEYTKYNIILEKEDSEWIITSYNGSDYYSIYKTQAR